MPPFPELPIASPSTLIRLLTGLTQATDFLPFVGTFFAPQGEKSTYKKSTMLPQAIIAFA
jgi:hypothetical protein